MNPSAHRHQAAFSQPRPRLTENDRRAIMGVSDQLIGRAGRTVLMMGLRGSRAKRAFQYDVGQTRGYGFYAGLPEPEVLARIDALIAEGILRLEYHDGFPLLNYTELGLARAMRYVAEEGLDLLRSHVQPVASGSPSALPFLQAAMPQRNPNTVLLLTDLVAQAADRSWLPLLRAWRSAETKRVRAALTPIIAALELIDKG